jgi:hypothetical protein
MEDSLLQGCGYLRVKALIAITKAPVDGCGESRVKRENGCC